jgi:NADPH-dependent F420 reductase
MSRDDAIAVIGGTGAQGLGLALRLCAAGCRVVIGSRAPERAARAAEEVRQRVPGAAVEGMDNAQAAAAAAALVVLSVPFENTAETVKGLRERLAPGQILVSMGVPIASAVGDGPSRLLGVWQGSCAELVAGLAPEGVEVVSALQNVSAKRLQALDEPIECDVVVSGAKGARAQVMELCERVPGLRAVNGGPLANARIVESMTALLIGLSARYKVAKGVGIRFTGLPE